MSSNILLCKDGIAYEIAPWCKSDTDNSDELLENTILFTNKDQTKQLTQNLLNYIV